jgi:hypothetical protein
MLLKRFMLIGVLSLFLSPVAAFSQDSDDDDGMTIEEVGTYFYKDEIKAGRLTAKQAGEYYRCSQEDYGTRLSKNRPLVERLNGRVEKLATLKQMSAAEKAAFDADDREVDKLWILSQEMCGKKLGLKVKPKSGN